MPLFFSGYKEVVITAKSRPKKASKPQRRSNLFIYIWREALIPTALIIVGVGGTFFFAVRTDNVDTIKPVEAFSLPTPKSQPQTVQAKGLTRSDPTSIRISRVGISTNVISVGKQADGTMEVPPLNRAELAGWYREGPSPGQIGPAVIVGHVDTKDGPAVFWRLRELIAGDIVEVTRADGQLVKFSVESLQQFDQNNFPTEAVYGDIDYAGIRLITCSGTFNRSLGKYTHNTVVFARIVQ